MIVWINLGRLVMLGVWSILITNLVHPFPRPLNIFMVLATVFMLLMHGVQFLLLKASQPKDAPPLSRGLQLRFFLFGVFELLAWQRKQPPISPKHRR
ncbi:MULTISPECIES: DUF1145 family protein [Musicola]|uniref:DUF1145 domain-containing protein n=1 Tax=Musicola paradisiaca (strain Ech703) TaxID=579405 RepID=C6C5J5_MUSP7|nr:MULTISPECIES: DUF1145 family protein [Musicola]ACS87632.1 protein of unknown function DUF1145 [Musicola paradisiaca Ech703]